MQAGIFARGQTSAASLPSQPDLGQLASLPASSGVLWAGDSDQIC